VFAHAQQWRDIERLELRIHGHAIAVVDSALESDRLTTDQYELDLGMRYTQRLDHMLDRGIARAVAGEIAAASRRWQKIVQFLVEAERRCGHHHRWLSRLPIRRAWAAAQYRAPAAVCSCKVVASTLGCR